MTAPNKVCKRNYISRVLAKIINKRYVNNILEIGSGKSSTTEIRKILQNKKKGFCISLEHDKFYRDYVISKVPDDQFGKVVFSGLIYDDKKGLRYDYKMEGGKYDFIYIDAPGLALIQKGNKMVSAKPDCLKYIARPDVCLQSAKRGGCRMFIFDYILPVMHDDTIVLVDSSKSAVLYYYQKHHKGYNFYCLGSNEQDTKGTNKIQRLLKPEYVKDIKIIPTKATIIVNRKSFVANRLAKSLKDDKILEIK